MNPTQQPIQFDQDTLQKIQVARSHGYDENTVMQKAMQYQMRKQAPADGAGQPAEKSTLLYDLLPLIGGIGGSFIPGLGTIAGGALGAGLGTLLKQGFEQKPVDVGEIAKEAALGGIGGVVGKGAGWLGGKLLGAGADAATQAGENLGVRALRLNKSQLAGFLRNHSEDAGAFLSKEGALGKGSAELVAQHIEPLQQQFNAIAKTSGVKVDPNTFVENVLKQYKELIDAGGTENAAIADKLLSEADHVLSNSLHPAAHDISAYDNLRRTFASKVNWNDPTKAAGDYAMADALRNTVIDAADQAGMPGLKDIGIKLSKFRDLEKAAVAQEQLGRGNMPMGITKFLAGGLGQGAAGPAGAAAGIGISTLVNHPSFLRLLANSAVKGGQALEQGLPMGVTGAIAGRTAAQATPRIPDALSAVMGGGQSFDPSQAVEGQIVGDSNAMPSASELGMGAMQGGGNPQEQALREILASIMFKKAKNVSDLKTAFDFYNPQSTQKPLNAAQQQLQANAQSGLRALDMVENTLKVDPNATWKMNIPVVSGRSPYGAAAREMMDVLQRLRTGAAINKDEQAFYEKQLPQPFDSPQVVAYKLSIFRNLFNKFANGQIPAAEPSGSMPQSYNLLTQ